MCHKLIEDARFFQILQQFDEDIAAETQPQGCECHGKLHRADYPRKPRGCLKTYEEAFSRRFSFCCDQEGCRKRKTPPSIRFLGRKVYLFCIVILATAMQQGVTPKRLSQLKQILGVSRRTLRRWRKWWQQAFRHSPFFKAARGLFAKELNELNLPLTLLDAFGWFENPQAALIQLLQLLAPITTDPHLKSPPF